ncbi:PQQ-binding-like beta-propeller repeat protein [Cohnella suwonensis]|uniref:PQQ-binding-like beta-propeller repeat protein n=1 Tax=Cohnella suwonensis TaxID=696072 RepID=A0ABW0LU83_9BACL
MKVRSIFRVSLIALVIGALSMSAVSAAAPPTKLPAKEYQELKYKNDRGEKLKFFGYKQFKIDWTKEMPDSVDIAMNKEKTRIFATNDNSVVAFDLSGKEAWRYELPNHDFNYYLLHIGADGTVYAVRQPQNLLGVNDPGYVAALSGQGQLLWEHVFDDQSLAAWMDYSGSAKGTFVTYTDNGIAGLRGGEIAWTNKEILEITTKTFGDYSYSYANVQSMFADRQGTTYVQTDAKTFALDEQGAVRWSGDIQGDLVLVQNDQYLLQTSPTGGWALWDAATGKKLSGALIKPLWLKDTGIANDRLGGLYISNFLLSKKNGISKIDARGKAIWSYAIRFPGYSDAYELVSDAAGNVFFTDSGGTFYSLDRNGNERFIFLYRNQYGPDSTKAVVDANGNVYALFNNIGLMKIAKIAKIAK